MARPSHGTEDRSVRLLKVGERVRHVLSELLTRQQVHDDILTGLNKAFHGDITVAIGL